VAADEWTYHVDESALREISRLPDGLDQEAIDTIEWLTDNPYPQDSEPLSGYTDRYRVYFGFTPKGRKNPGYRLIYSVNERRRLIRVLRVRPRPEAYKGMRNP
jgi:mRNA-degrading endonuclease RelE of RelBE toxin-antitoxin system